jgi:hypothetical protein
MPYASAPRPTAWPWFAAEEGQGPFFHRSAASHDSRFNLHHSCRQLPDQPTGSAS